MADTPTHTKSDTPDILTLSGLELMTLKGAIEQRLEEIRQRHLEEAHALGLTLLRADGAPKRKRRARTAEEAD